MIARDVKRKKMVERFSAKRKALMAAFHSAKDPMERLEIHRKIQDLPRNSAQIGFVIAVGQRVSPVAFIAPSAYVAISFANVPTKVNFPVWSSPAGSGTHF